MLLSLCAKGIWRRAQFRLMTIFFLHRAATKEGGAKIMEVCPIGCASIYLRSGRSHEYITIPLSLSNKGWHKQWFYLWGAGQGT
jgi:hypothetical protein